MATESTSPPPAPQAQAAKAPITVALPGEDFAWAQARAEREGTSVTAVVAEAVRKARQNEAWAAFRDAVLDGQPPITDDERAEIEREWQG